MLNKLRKAFVPLFIMGLRSGTLAAKFLLALFITRYLGLADLGWYGLIVGVTIVLPVFMNFGLLNTLAREAVGKPVGAVALLFRNYWALVLTAYAVLALVLGTAQALFAVPVMLLVVLGVSLLEHLNQDIFILLVNRYVPVMANLLLFVRSGLWIFVYMGAALLWPALRTLDTLLLFWLIGLLLPLMTFAVYARNWGWVTACRQPWSLRWFKQALGRARVLYVADVANNASQYLDRYLIGLFLGVEITGVYVLFWQVGNALYNLVSTSVIHLYRPRLIEAAKLPERTAHLALYRRCLVKCLGTFVGLAAVGSGAFVLLIPYLNQPRVSDFLPVLAFVLVGMLCRLGAEAAGQTLYSRHDDKLVMQTGLGVLALSGLLNGVLLYVYHDIYMAAAVLIAVYAMLFFWRARLVSRAE